MIPRQRLAQPLQNPSRPPATGAGATSKARRIAGLTTTTIVRVRVSVRVIEDVPRAAAPDVPHRLGLDVRVALVLLVERHGRRLGRHVQVSGPASPRVEPLCCCCAAAAGVGGGR